MIVAQKVYIYVILWRRRIRGPHWTSAFTLVAADLDTISFHAYFYIYFVYFYAVIYYMYI